ncbi:MAG: YdcF family protein [Candidatus Symbiobacter sp.]|nr:YdcF family protein [Candidatus Symbiobacter sp.]
MTPWFSRKIGLGVLACAVTLLLVGLWLDGLTNFAKRVPQQNQYDLAPSASTAPPYNAQNAGPARGVAPPPRADGIVVLTGGSLRTQAGLQLLLAGRAQRLFISGVNFDEGLNQQIAAYLPPRLRLCCVELGRKAGDTPGNASETAEWVSRYRVRTLYVVTASYHMPRALLEFYQAMPHGVVLLPYPVFPAEFSPVHWWGNDRSRGLLIREYNKYLLAWFLSLRTHLKNYFARY